MAEKRLDVVIIGELNIDLVLINVPMPENDKEMLAEDMRFAMGSSSAITAHNLASIGAKVGFIGKAGIDNFGDYMIKKLAAGGVETLSIIRDKNLKTGASIVLANLPHRAVLTYMGAMKCLAIDDMDWDYISQARHLHLGCYYLQPGIRPDLPAIFAKAKELGMTTSLDTNWDPEDKWDKDLFDVLKHTDIFFPNEDEALRIAKTDDIEKAIEFLRQKVRVLVVKRSDKGSILCTNDKTFKAPSFHVTPVEVTGAGDSFNSGFIYKFLQNSDWTECLRFGNACGANAVTAIGGTGAFTDKKVLQENLKQILKSAVNE